MGITGRLRSVCWALSWAGFWLGTQSLPAAEPTIPTALQDYVNRPDDSFAWKLNGVTEDALGKIYDVELTSQTWQGITWKHVLLIAEPKQVQTRDHVLLFISGGSHLNKPNEDGQRMALVLANLTGARVASLHQVPNQPLLENRKEDDLISETFLRYLATKDATWPLLFPMVKSAVRAMDAVEQIAAKEWQQKLQGFVVTGASKRGWTTWLSAVADPRVKGIAPIVIDTLNFPKQTAYQLETWGTFSEQIADYTSKGLVKKMDTEPDNPLWDWVDPYTYRKQLTLPKLIINGTNDRYWTVDALNNYWDDLSGPKYIRYVPNAGHNLKGGQEGALATLAAFFRVTAAGKPLPAVSWKHTTDGNKYRLEIQSRPAPQVVKLWTARSATKDFRDATWTAVDLPVLNGIAVGEIERPADGHLALFGEAHFSMGALEYTMSTQIRRE